MNEYLGKGVPFGAPGFSDVFDEHTEQRYYRDSPLSELGRAQAKALGGTKPRFLKDCELIVTSPLTRALQTLEGGVWAPMRELGLDRTTPILALPDAAERLYLISDVGRPVRDLSKEFEYVDFASGFVDHSPSSWWYRPASTRSGDNIQRDDEWRPVGQGQRYACPGEPEPAFNARMEKLFEWIWDWPERKIAVVCHWGVIKWMLGTDFGNCQWREVGLADLMPAKRPVVPYSTQRPQER
jgi:broad specificity phosphatase PhoE